MYTRIVEFYKERKIIIKKRKEKRTKKLSDALFFNI